MLNLHNVPYPSICGGDVVFELIWVKLIQELLSCHEHSSKSECKNAVLPEVLSWLVEKRHRR